MATTYTVSDGRVIFPKGKVAEKRPDLFCTVKGTFHNAKGEEMTIASKQITVETAKHPDFRLVGPDAKSIIKVTLPSGKRGRKAEAGATQSDIEAKLKALRG